MIYTCSPEKVSIYVNTNNKTIKQIQQETGCTAIINGGLFNMSDYTPNCHLKVDGKVYATDPYKYWGFAWNTNKLAMVQSYSSYKNYICCVCLVRNHKAETLIYDPGVSGSRPRTAIGVFEDGRIWLLADKTNRTPEALQRLCLEQGLKYAMMLDGGGSTQCRFPDGAVTSTRKVANLICVWEKVTPGENDVCPYTTPIINIKFGSKGTGVKWLQWQLNRHGAKLIVDGIFGNDTNKALLAFQRKHGLTPDAICGAKTRAELKK